jgi:hypothetical protein
MCTIPGLLHEVWMRPDECHPGEHLPACTLFGPDGDDARASNEPGSYCVLVFWATSHFDAMTFYHQWLHGETYTTREELDYRPYPAELTEAQRKYLDGISGR